MPPVRPRGWITYLWRAHRWLYGASGGRLGGRLLGMPVLLLTTTGRRTGQRHMTALTYLPEGLNFVVIASNGGAHYHPDWYLNLRARAEVEVLVGRRQTRARAREADGAERARLWGQIVRANSRYAGYQARTSRRIPVVVLERMD